MRTLAFTIAVVMALPALAQTNPATPPPAAPKASEKPAAPAPAKPSEKLTSTFKGAAGTWKCKSEVSMPGQPKMEGTSTMKIAPVMNGFAYTMDYSGTMKGMPPFKGMIMWTAEGDKLAETWADNMGGMMRGTSDGEVDGKTVWMEEGVMMGKPAKSRTTITRKGKGEITVVGEMADPSGNWAQFSQDTCTKKG